MYNLCDIIFIFVIYNLIIHRWDKNKNKILLRDIADFITPYTDIPNEHSKCD